MSDTAPAVDTTATPADQPVGPQLQLGDIEAAIKVIDYAAEQGAFKGWNVIQEVLVLRQRLAAFYGAVAPKPEEVDVPESPAEAAANPAA